jgi:hypothetical protein
VRAARWNQANLQAELPQMHTAFPAGQKGAKNGISVIFPNKSSSEVS